MPLNVRSAAVSLAVICFFVMSLIGWVSGLPPYICCKRAIIGATLAYIAGGWAIRAINSLLLDAMIANRMNQQDGDEPANTKVAFGDRNGDATD